MTDRPTDSICINIQHTTSLVGLLHRTIRRGADEPTFRNSKSWHRRRILGACSRGKVKVDLLHNGIQSIIEVQYCWRDGALLLLPAKIVLSLGERGGFVLRGTLHQAVFESTVMLMLLCNRFSRSARRACVLNRVNLKQPT